MCCGTGDKCVQRHVRLREDWGKSTKAPDLVVDSDEKRYRKKQVVNVYKNYLLCFCDVYKVCI